MRVIINGRFYCRKTTGVERYAREVIKELDKICGKNEILIAVPDQNYISDHFNNISIIEIKYLRGILWEQISLPFYAKKNGYQILNFCNVSPVLKPDIVVIHDAMTKSIKKDYKLVFRIWYSFVYFFAKRKAIKLFTVSNFSRKELGVYYRFNEKKITIAPSAPSHFQNIIQDESVIERLQLTKNNFYFSLGSIKPNKNFNWIAQIAINNPNEIFVISGNINKSIFKDGLTSNMPSNMLFAGFLNDSEAKSLMGNCKAFLFPSTYEGFGLPPLEATVAGCKNLIVSDIEIMHEVYSDYAIYVNPNKYDYVVNDLLNTVHKDPIDLLETYSWNKTASIIYSEISSINND